MGIGLLACSANAEELASYNFDPVNDLTNFEATGGLATNATSGVIAEAANVGPGLTQVATATLATLFAAEGQGMDDGTDDNMAGAITAGDYFTFTISADDGYYLNLENITFDVTRSSRGCNDYSIRSSVDEFATDIVTGTADGYSNQAILTTTSNQNIDLSDAAYDKLESIEFRIYFDDRENNNTSSSATYVDNWILNGTVESANTLSLIMISN